MIYLQFCSNHHYIFFMKKNTYERIYMRGCQWIGDAIMTIPAIRAIRKAYPKAHLSMISPEGSYSIYAPCPYLDEVIPYNEKWKLSKQREHIKQVKALHFDAAVLLAWSFNAALMPYLSGIKPIVGVKSDYRGFLLHKKLKTNTWRNHQIDIHLHLSKHNL